MTENVMKQITLDVSELPAPEPFSKIMAALVELDTNQYLKVLHRKQPLLLYKPLVESGFNFHVQKGSTEAFDIFIWHTNQAQPQGLIKPSLADISNTKTSCSD